MRSCDELSRGCNEGGALGAQSRDPVTVQARGERRTRTRTWIVPGLVMAAWFASLFTIDAITDDGNLQALVFAAYSLVAGVLAGRWWVLLVPPAAVLALILYGDVIDPCEDCRDELGVGGRIYLGLLFSAGAAITLAIGVAIRRGIALLRLRRA